MQENQREVSDHLVSEWRLYNARRFEMEVSCGGDREGLAVQPAAVLFQRGDFKFIAKSYREMTLWLLGPGSMQTYENLTDQEPALCSTDFTDTGYFFIRSDWDSNAKYALLIFKKGGKR